MADIPPLSSSTLAALQNGFQQLDRGAAEIVKGTVGRPVGGDLNDVRMPPDNARETDTTLSGIRDLMLARLTVGAGAALLHTYKHQRSELYAMLRNE